MIAAIFVLAGSALTGALTLLGAYLRNKSDSDTLKTKLEEERRSKADTLLREKLEDTHVSIRRWANFILGEFFSTANVMDGRYTLEQSMELLKESNKDSSFDFHKIEMTIQIYFPEMLDQYKGMIVKREEASAFMFRFREEYLRGRTDGRIYLQPFVSAQAAFEGAVNEFLNNLAELARNWNTR